MRLDAGAQLGLYEIIAPIGAGGMGEVYRATDTRLGREVAIKILPLEFARDPERLARFEREARVLAALNHPNIAAIYGFEQCDGVPYLVLELVEGEALRGPLPLDEAVAVAKQIADALEAAHEKGIVHRDLKPANVKITPGGKVKVLDFGLAKALAGESSPGSLATSPTLTAAATGAGVLLGTAAYMSPEQARGKTIDKRTDIWAFGCVVYELLTGRKVFDGESISDVLAAVLKSNPDWNALPIGTPPRIRRLLRRCLERDLGRRLRDIADARLELDEQPAPEPAAAAPTPRASQWTAALPWITVAVLGVAAGLWGLLRRPEQQAQPPIRFTIALPHLTRPPGSSPIAFSRDGARLVYVGQESGRRRLYLRAMDQLEMKPIPGTEDASGPFFSPDGQWIGFFAGGKLKKVAVAGGAAIALCDSPLNRGATWTSDDAIIFGPGFSTGLLKVSAAGGTPEVFTTIDAQSEQSHRWPEILPGGRALLLTAGSPGAASYEQGRILVLDLKTKARSVLVEGGADARYLSTGHIVYGRAGSLFAVPFDLAKLHVTGSPVPILEGITTAPISGSAEVAFSESGTLVYTSGGGDDFGRTLVSVDRKGNVRPLPAPPRAYDRVRLSPDGTRLALAIQRDLWVYELARGALIRLTSQFGSVSPVWSPDGKRVAYAFNRPGGAEVLAAATDGSGGSEQLLTREQFRQFNSGYVEPYSWSRDGRFLTFQDPIAQKLWTVSLDGDRKPQALVSSPFAKAGPQFSPDGRWLAYSSNETGRFEVYVQQFPRPGAKTPISTDGGTEPRWTRNGREVVFRSGDRVMIAEVENGAALRVGKPVPLFEGRYETSYDVTPDGQRFIMIKPGDQAATAGQVTVVRGWFEELKRRVPVPK